MKKWLFFVIIALISCTKEDDNVEEIIPPLAPPVKCDIKIKACTPQVDDTVYLTWIDTNYTVHEHCITSCLYIQSHYYTRDTIFLQYNALQNNINIQINVNQVLMLDTTFLHLSEGVLNYIVEEPDL